ncbi:type II CRISPR-associated endonuclease Cas1 [Polaribacter tangerinus]|uniref:type II CRISPR-associated endonuclease Cas1 n=1 Tax=Polaribacter tangerinus TaxID=1920034 RepID=UPI000B4B25F8|nr:type II CRISPR-associated endonuclease Cas1 [Polaribacter tangerinus]
MIKRTIYIGNPAYLKLQQQQLVVQEPQSKTIKGTVPIEDIALLMLDHYQITLSNQLLIQLQGNNVAVISCDAQHLPFGVMLPLYGHTQYAERVRHQMVASEPLKKQLWKQTVTQKIANQATLLALHYKNNDTMLQYQHDVKSGDTTNREGMAAQYYWKHILDNFARHREGDAPNNLLNFGYGVLRSIVARALVCSGLLPVLGIFHKNKYNPYALADDIMEPYRPFVDKLVINYINNTQQSTQQLTPKVKAHLLTIATQDVFIDSLERPLFVAVTTTTASLYKCYTGELRQIKYPELD